METLRTGGTIRGQSPSLILWSHGSINKRTLLVTNPCRKRTREPRPRRGCEGDSCSNTSEKDEEGGRPQREKDEEEKMIPLSLIIFSLKWNQIPILKWIAKYQINPRVVQRRAGGS